MNDTYEAYRNFVEAAKKLGRTFDEMKEIFNNLCKPELEKPELEKPKSKYYK